MRTRSLSVDDIDNLGKAVLTLTKELWVMKDRMMVLEAVLEKHGLSVTEEVDTFEPGEALSKQLSDERSLIIKNVLQSLNPAPGTEASPGGRVKPGQDEDAILNAD